MSLFHRKIKTTLSKLAAALVLSGASLASADSITVGYFMEWPTPNQYAQVNKLYDKALGVEVKWVSFDAGTAMSAAMASGDVQISFSQGIPPFVVAASAGQDIQIVDVAVSYSDDQNCVVRESLEIDKDNASELAGKKAAVPIGTAAHYGFLKQMQYFGVDPASMQIVDMAPPDGAAAFANGNFDIVCGWGGALRRMKEHGNVLLTGSEIEKLGIQVFDATSVDARWAQENPQLLTDFLRVTAQMNRNFANGKADEMLPVIAKAAGMDIEATADTLKNFSFPTVEQQLSEQWLGGGTQQFLKAVGDFFVEQGTIPSALDDYTDAVDSSYLQATMK